MVAILEEEIKRLLVRGLLVYKAMWLTKYVISNAAQQGGGCIRIDFKDGLAE